MTTYLVSINGRPYARFVRLEHVASFLWGDSRTDCAVTTLVQRMMHTGSTEIGAYLIEVSERKSL